MFSCVPHTCSHLPTFRGQESTWQPGGLSALMKEGEAAPALLGQALEEQLQLQLMRASECRCLLESFYSCC